ncbi:MAG TPA: chemotaxis protein CheA [Nitrospirae bacterium]|nr:chemotaxis protein CheA [Nitrospirota bacterium]
MNPLLEQFLIETRDFLEGIGEKVIELESASDDAVLLNELFRLVHTLKGNSGLFDFPEMTRVLHASEDLLDAIRSGKMVYTREVADYLLDAMDFVSMLCDEIEAEGAIKSDHAEESSRLAASIRDLMKDVNPAIPPEEITETKTTEDHHVIAREWLLAIPEDARREAYRMGKEGSPIHYIQYTPSEECFYQGDDPFYLVRQIRGLLWHDIMPRRPWQKLQEMDAYACNLVFTMLVVSSREEIAEHFRYVMDQVEIIPLSDKDLELLCEDRSDGGIPSSPQSCSSAEKYREDQEGSCSLTGTERSLLADILRIQKDILSLPDNVEWFKGRLKAVASTFSACCVQIGKKDALAELESSLKEAILAASPEPLQVWFDKHLSMFLDSEPDVEITLRMNDTEKRINSLASSQMTTGHVSKDGGPISSENAGSAMTDKNSKGRAENRTTSRVLKVDQAKIDRLMNLIGEMVVSKNALPYLASRAEDVYGIPELGREIKSHYISINRIVEEMQDAIMQVRMVPVAHVFQRFPRLVRDIANKLQKEVELIIEGEETEADKNIIESLAEPLIHIIRNSLDHGIELPEERIKAGKPPKGRLAIRAVQESDCVVIEISDDGRGIDPELIKLKAYEKGIIDEETLECITDQDAVNLIMAAGFSTSETVSDLSGRGVGMDVVRNAVEKVKGNIKIESEKGKGTRITLSLPLSVAVTNVMIVKSDGRKFGVPMDTVVETVRIPDDEVSSVKDKRVAILRDQVVPLFNLNDLLCINSPQRLNEEGELAVLVVRTYSGNAGIVVDEFYETTDIILKPMEGILAGIKAYAGTALLGDGSVLIVLNPKELV